MTLPLPNQIDTWKGLTQHLETFDDWDHRTAGTYNSASTKMLVYLADQLKAEGAELPTFNNPVSGMLSHMSESAPRLQELMLAYLTLAVTGDTRPAVKIISGQRLHTGLHPDYVELTQCYDEDDDSDELLDPTASNAAIAFALELGDSNDGLLFLKLWNEGEFDELREEWPDAPIEVYGAESKPPKRV